MRSLQHTFLLIVFISCMTPHRDLSFADNVVVAHRGAWKKNDLPENSVAALREAINLGCTGAEFDVWMTADDSLVVNHDADHHGLPIERTSYAALAAFRLPNGEKLPTLREYIRAGLKDNDSTRLVCELKPSEVSQERGKAIATRAVELIQELQAQPWVMYISFDYGILERILELEPNAPTQYLKGDKSPDAVHADGISGIDYHFSVFQKHPEWIQQAKKNGMALNAWTVNKVADMDRLLAQGFDYITTNEPELLMERMKKFTSATR